MRTIILAGGKGTRLSPLTNVTPKPLIPIKGEPIINHLIRFFAGHGVREFGIVISRDHERQFGEWRIASEKTLVPAATYSLFVEEKPRGTFGYLRHLKEWTAKDPFFLVNGDSLLDFDLNALVKFHMAKKPVATIGLRKMEDAGEFGSVLLEEGNVRGFEEKSPHPQSSIVSVGLYLLEQDIFKYDDPSCDFLMIEKDIFPRMAEDKVLAGFEIGDGRFFDCGTFARLERAQREW